MYHGIYTEVTEQVDFQLTITVTNLKRTTTNWPAPRDPSLYVILVTDSVGRLSADVGRPADISQKCGTTCRSTMSADNDGPCGATLNGKRIGIVALIVRRLSLGRPL